MTDTAVAHVDAAQMCSLPEAERARLCDTLSRPKPLTDYERTRLREVLGRSARLRDVLEGRRPAPFRMQYDEDAGTWFEGDFIATALDPATGAAHAAANPETLRAPDAVGGDAAATSGDAALAGVAEIGADFKQRGGVAPSQVRGTVPFYGLYESEPNYAALAQPTERRAAFKPSNGMLFSVDFKYAKHRHARDQRETLLSESWVHEAHPNKKIRFVVQPVIAAYSHGDIFVGLTEASVPWGRGASVAVDCEKNEINGLRPSVIHFSSHVESPPPGENHRNDIFVVTADLARRRGTVECYRQDAPLDLPDFDGLPRWRHTFSLERWKSARLFVSMCSFEDSIEFVSCE